MRELTQKEIGLVDKGINFYAQNSAPKAPKQINQNATRRRSSTGVLTLKGASNKPKRRRLLTA